MEFKIPIAKWSEECFYQDLVPSEIFHVIFNVMLLNAYFILIFAIEFSLLKVLKGGKMKIHLIVSDPNQKLIYQETTTYTWYHIDNVTDAGSLNS